MRWLFCLLLVSSAQYGEGNASNEGTRFHVALSPSFNNYYHAELIITARQTTQVTITIVSSSEVVTVYGNGSLHYDYHFSMRTNTGIENKGISVSSEEPVTVHVATVTTDDLGNLAPDAFLVRPYQASSTEYFLAAYDEMWTNGNSWPMSYFMIVATEDNTQVGVYYTDNGIAIEDENLTLQTHQVFTKDCYHLDGQPLIDFTGTRVVATKAVSVYSGNGLADISAVEGSPNVFHLVESMPALNEIGHEYITFPVHFGGDGGYEVRVIAVADDTDVTVPTFSNNVTSQTLNMGEFHVIDNNVTKQGFKISCTKPCLCVQYTRSLPTGGDSDLRMNPFLAVLIPEERSSQSLVFTVPSDFDFSEYMVAAISIITTSFQVTGLYLDDTSLADLDWQSIENSTNRFSSVEIGAGFHQLYTVDTAERFTAYLYVMNTRSPSGPASGFPIGYSGDATVPSPTTTPDPTTTADPPTTTADPPTTTPERPTTTPEPPTTTPEPPTTTPEPPTTTPAAPPGGEPPSPPWYKIVLLGNFSSDSGENFTSQCTQSLGDNLQSKAATMIPRLNNMIGQELCDYIDGNVAVVSMSSMLKTNGATGVSDVSYLLEANSDVVISNLTSCAAELRIYLEDFDNWGRPVVPPVQDCPDVLFDPDHFFDGSTGSNWLCLSKDENTALYEIDTPAYSLALYDNFTTLNDEVLDASCSQDYKVVWQLKAAGMVTTLNDAITAGIFCSGGSGKLVVTISTTSFFSQDIQGTLTSTFYMRLEYDHLRFDDVHQCVNEMFVFLADHNNWGALPLLPQQPGCPHLVFEPPTFYHNGESWRCADFVL